VATVLGFFVLGGVEFHALNVAGICLNTSGGCWYSIIKYKERQAGRTKTVHRDEEQDAQKEELLPLSSGGR
jgi:solute carrier family 35